MCNIGGNSVVAGTKKGAVRLALATFATACLFSQGYAVDRNTNDEVDNPFGKVEKGWHFYEDANQTDTQKRISVSATPQKGVVDPALIASLLQQILDENKEQTITQKEILRILQENFDPQPKIVTRPDGTECIANSSADCYVVPKTPFAKSIPALSAWMDDPSSVEKAAVYSKWQSIHLNTTVLPMGSSLQFAGEQFGVEARPLNYASQGYDNATGAGQVMQGTRVYSTVNKHAHQVQLIYFVGKNIDADLYSLDNYGRLMERLDKVKFTTVVYDQATEKVINDAQEWMPPLKRGLAHNNKVIVGQKAFERYGIYTTPSLVAVITKDGKMKAQTIATGRLGPEIWASRVREYLLLEGIAKYGDDAGYKIWKDEGKVSDFHLRNYYNVDLNKTYIEEIKKKQEGIR